MRVSSADLALDTPGSYILWCVLNDASYNIPPFSNKKKRLITEEKIKRVKGQIEFLLIKFNFRSNKKVGKLHQT